MNYKKIGIVIASISVIYIILAMFFIPALPFFFDFTSYQRGYKLQEAYPNLRFNSLVDLQHADDGSNFLYAVQQTGEIYRFENNYNVTTKQLFLDISDRVSNAGTEMGLLGLTFDPNFETNGYFYVDYTRSDPRETVISRFEIDTTTGLADSSSEHIILSVSQPAQNHNAGAITFGPDGYFYITLGDGGGAGDTYGNGQDLTTLLGSILRIDVSNSSEIQRYRIPPDNPFVNNSNEYREEIFAYGLRNPWRISFDTETGDLWAGDVGQFSYEEIDLIEKGNNYGWPIMEGTHCYSANSCDQTGLTLPVVDYPRDDGKTVTGGYVYRGTNEPELYGKYFYADYIVGRIWYLNAETPSDPDPFDVMKYNKNFSSFGVDQQNELYILEHSGIIWDIVEE